MHRFILQTIFVGFVTLLSFHPANSQDTNKTPKQAKVLERYVAHSFTDASDYKLLYRELSPLDYKSTSETPGSKSDVAANKTFPLVIFLHGAGERGNDNRAQLKHGLPQFASDAVMQEYPCFVIAPQCPRKSRWVEVDWSADAHTTPEQPSEPMAALMELIEHKTETLPIDRKRIYVTGMSMGGYGTWDLITRRPQLFAAAVPVCGGGDSTADAIERIKHIPLRVVHGDKDRAVPVKRSRDMVAALKKVGSEPIYIELPGVGHNSWTATYTNPAMFAWMFKQRQK